MTLTRDELIQLIVRQIGLGSREAREMLEKVHGVSTGIPEAGAGSDRSGMRDPRSSATGQSRPGDREPEQKRSGEVHAVAVPKPGHTMVEVGGKTPRRG
jgi:hypothetical protein